jgi:hypothetical protein
MSSIDFESEPAYWYIKTMRDTERAGLAKRWRPAVNRDEALKAQEVRRRVGRTTFGHRGFLSNESGYTVFVEMVAHAHICAKCNEPFSRRAGERWRERRLWRVIYPRAGGRIEVWRHTVCPVERGR